MHDDLFDIEPKNKLEVINNRGVVAYVKAHPSEALADAIPYMASSQLVYQRSNRLVQVLYNHEVASGDIIRDEDSPVISDISPAHLWEILAHLIDWKRYDGRLKAWVGCEPPRQVVSAIHGRGYWPGLPRLRGISTVPILREDGSIRMEPGYDDESGLFYAPNSGRPVIPGAPTREDAQKAAADLLDVVRDFPFVAPYHRSIWLSSVLSGIARPIIDGGIPMVMVSSNTPGTGKSLLVDVASVLVTGTSAARSPDVREEDELRKRIASHLAAGDQMCLIDNVRGGSKVGWSVLDAALTAGVWSDRELGKTSRLRFPMNTMWFCTGNNLSIGADSARRTLVLSLEASDANPEKRTGFKWDPILSEVRRERPFLLGKAINILRAFIHYEKPSSGLPPIGSFEGWSRLIRDCLVWVGLPDPGIGLASEEEGIDEEADARRTLLTSWNNIHDITTVGQALSASEILEGIERHRGDCRDIIDALAILVPTRDGSLPTSRRLGIFLRSMINRRHEFDGKLYSVIREQDRLRMARWRVEIEEKKSFSTNDALGIQKCAEAVPASPIPVPAKSLPSNNAKLHENSSNAGTAGTASYTQGRFVNDSLYIGGENQPPTPFDDGNIRDTRLKLFTNTEQGENESDSLQPWYDEPPGDDDDDIPF